jgi:uncharacterized protein (DUF58 family)
MRRLPPTSAAASAAAAATAAALANGSGAAEQVLRRLEWTVLKRLDGLLHGDYRTLFRGFGLDLADLREYQYHDDVRHIDWNVTARLQTPYVRQFTEDRELAAWFVLDLSPSISFGSGAVDKGRLSAEFVAVLARLLTRHGNRVGALLYGARTDTVIPARGGRPQVLHLLHRMLHRPEAAASGGGTDLQALLHDAAQSIRRRSLVFVVSDFISDTDWGRSLTQLAQRHEVVAVRLYDPLEMELPNLGLVTVQDAETGEQVFVDTHDAGFRQRYRDLALQREAQLRQDLAGAGVDALELATDEDLADALLRFTELRKLRQRLTAGAVTSAPMPAHLAAAGTAAAQGAVA